MSPKDIDIAAETATSFINDYLIKHGNFTPDDEVDVDVLGSLRFSFYRAMPDRQAPGTIVYSFMYGTKFQENSPELQKLVQQSMDALKQAHPEVFRFKSLIELDPADY
ncbi:hypothetical protein MYSTI_06885 [Myxococcus stipitatus DSM 14675]|uniref:Uncharacterized protein n=1 Tax=Myxococcus stipitatus (strain DSM 14675 / JCM 12634 / Mx s8) TaxID=1278073 RepID=L7UJH6_MYXSD|nr:hypothetical protein [Myxococcus stipitatus]AGC48158.1 hypothetical protein MYSTI_06885 [Myxococcus stipitatus DSM 14675]